MEDFSSEKDLPNQKNYTIFDKEYMAHRTDPYGFWHLTTDKGEVPEVLGGQFTSTIEIDRAITNYIADENHKKAQTSKKEEAEEV